MITSASVFAIVSLGDGDHMAHCVNGLFRVHEMVVNDFRTDGRVKHFAVISIRFPAHFGASRALARSRD